MNYLEENDLIQVKDIGESSGGRKPQLYGINPHSGYVIGIDIARLYTKIVLMDLESNIIKSHAFGMYGESTWKTILNKISLVYDEFSSYVGKDKILGTGIGTIGPINKQNNMALNPEKFLAAGWNDINMVKDIEALTERPAFLENGVNTAALAEYMDGLFKNYRNMVYIVAGMGLRLGLIENGKLVTNSDSYHGGFGHLTIEHKGRRCYCGDEGCLEAYVSIPSIMNEFREKIKYENSHHAEKFDYDLFAINFDHFCEAVQNGDALAVGIVEEASDRFAYGLKAIINILNPEIVILGGPLIKKCEMFYRRSVDIANKMLQSKDEFSTVLSTGNLGDDAAVIGAGNLVLHYYLSY